MPDMDHVQGIEYPKSREQLMLLLLRWCALNSAGVDPNRHEEFRHLTVILQAVGAQQREFVERKARLDEIRASRISNGTSPLEHTELQVPITALKLLTRNVDLPEALQAQLIQLAGEPVDEPATKQHENGSTKRLTFKERSARLGLEPEIGTAAGGGAEMVIRSRLSHRLNELERLPANIGAVDVETPTSEPPDIARDGIDELKIKALIELKQLRLLTRQKSMRQHIVYHIASTQDTMSQSYLTRLFNRRVKPLTAHDLQLTETLERAQRKEQEKKERAQHLKLINASIQHAQEALQQSQQRASRHHAMTKAVTQFHALVEREEAKRTERTARQRLQALRSNDEEAYLKLLDQTKDTRITHLLKQTNQFLQSLSEAVRVQQAEVGPTAKSEESPTEDNDKVDYYEVAHRVKEDVTEQPKMLVSGKLKEYQVKGLQWMVSLVNNNLNGILADEMGLGKTIQSISLISYLLEAKRWSGPFLVIVPLSTITNWNVEFDKWAPSIKKVVYKGPPNTRKALQGTIRAGDFQVLLTTYEYIIKDRPLLSKIRWQHMIIDEGHRMKNTQSKLSSTLSSYYHSRHRLILTGTPLQNNLPELWALLNFVLPKIFNSVKTFDEWFNTPFASTGGQDKMELTEEETLLIIRRLHKVLRPFLLRRLKKDVEKDLPDKIEKVVKCQMSALQLKLYEHMLKHNILYTGAPADSGSNKVGIKGLNNKIMQLRKICNHPYVFEEVENLINPFHVDNDNLWRVAGKFELLDRILPKFKATGHRVLIFFQMTQVMTIMEDYLHLRGIKYLRLDGATKADERSEMLKAFNAPDSPYFCFLLSTRAGGLGLNLQTADTVIIYDTDWNPFQDLQAQDRAHRIGQTKEVRILRLITEDSVEEAILDRALSKLEIDGKVIQAGKFDNKSTAEEQEAFLRSLMEAEEQRRENKSEEDEADDDELNDILARNDEEVTIFKKMDEERVAANVKNEPRLFSSEELPEIYKQDIKIHLEPPAEMYGRRERKRIVYEDALSDEQWLQTMQQQEDEEEGGRRSRRAKRSPAPDSDSTDYEAKKAKVDLLTPEEREELNKTAESVWEAISESVAPGDPPRARAGIFMELPSKKLYPDYYRVIKRPISLAEIRRSIDTSGYNSVEELKENFDLMFSNARNYNQEGSIVYEDAQILQSIVDSIL